MTRRRTFHSTHAGSLAVLIAVCMVLMLSAGCGNKKENADADLTDASVTDAAADEAAEGETDADSGNPADSEEADSSDMDETSAETGDTEESEETEEETEPEGTVADDETTAAEGTTAAEESSAGTTAAGNASGGTTTVQNTTKETTTMAASGYTYTSMNKTMYVSKQVNVRSLPSTDGKKLGSLTAGTAVTVTGQCNETGWYRIEYNGGVGYCSDNYLTGTQPTTTAASGESSEDDSEYVELTLEEFYSVCISYVVALVNEERVAAGVPELSVDVTLVEVAMTRAEELATLFSHSRPDGSSCYTAFDEAGYDYSYAGENIAYGFDNPYDVMDAWMNSEGHRANILDEDFTCIGVGVYLDDSGYLYWTQEFASPYRTNTPDDCSHSWYKFVGEVGSTTHVGDSEGNTLVTERVLYESVYYICENCGATCADLTCQHNWVLRNTGNSAYVGTCSGLEYTIEADLYYYVCTKCGAYWVE